MDTLDRIISIISPDQCQGCGEAGSLACLSCTEQMLVSKSSKSYGLFEYQGLAKQLVRLLKYGRSRRAAQTIADILNRNLPQTDWDVVTFAPTAPKRARQRGYDQAQLMAKYFCRKRGLSVMAIFCRTSSIRQVGSTRDNRKLQSKGLFFAGKSLLNQHVLIIDDVSTTGATLESAMAAAKLAGARKVDVVAFAAKSLATDK